MWEWRAAPPFGYKKWSGREQRGLAMFGLWVAIIVFGGVCCFAGVVVGYLGLMSSLFPEKVRTREIGTVVTGDLWKLRICRYRRGRTEGEPVLFVHGLGTNHHNFTEPANACLVDYLVEKGYDCWVLDLRGTRSSKVPFERDPNNIHLDDFLQQDIPSAIEHIRRSTGYAKVHYVGHSLGGMMLYAHAVDTGAPHIASAVTLGAPLGFDGVRAKAGLALLPVLKRFPLLCVDLLKGTLPFIAPLRVNLGVFPMNARNVHPSLRVSDFYNMIDVPVPTVLSEMAQILKTKTWKMNHGKLDVKAGLTAIDIPLMVIVGARDPFTPLEHTKRFIDALPHQDKRLLVCSRENGCKHDYGHCDLAFGVDGPRAVFKPIAEWFAEHPIRERLAVNPETEHHLMTPLDGDTRSGMLSGERYASLPQKHEAEYDVEPPPAVFPEEKSEYLRERQAALQGIALKVGSVEKPVKKETVKAPAKAKAVPAKTTAAPAKTTTKPVAAKAAAKPAPKPAAKAPAKVAAKPVAKSPAKPAPAKAAAKPVAKAKAAPAKPAAAKAKAVTKPAPAKAAPKKPAASKGKTATLSVLKAASEELKKLDKRK